MYEKFVQKKWQLEIINISKSDAGGFKEVIFSVMETIYTLTLNMNLVFIVYKGYLRQRHREEYILQLQQ